MWAPLAWAFVRYGSDYAQLDRILAPDQPKSGGLFPEQRWVLQLSIAVDLRRVPDLLKANRQRAPRQIGNDVERRLHVLANLVIAVGFVPGVLDGEGSGAPAAVRHDRVGAHESAAGGRVDGVGLAHVQGKHERTSGRERRRRGD